MSEAVNETYDEIACVIIDLDVSICHPKQQDLPTGWPLESDIVYKTGIYRRISMHIQMFICL